MAEDQPGPSKNLEEGGSFAPVLIEIPDAQLEDSIGLYFFEKETPLSQSQSLEGNSPTVLLPQRETSDESCFNPTALFAIAAKYKTTRLDDSSTSASISPRYQPDSLEGSSPNVLLSIATEYQPKSLADSSSIASISPQWKSEELQNSSAIALHLRMPQYQPPQDDQTFCIHLVDDNNHRFDHKILLIRKFTKSGGIEQRKIVVSFPNSKFLYEALNVRVAKQSPKIEAIVKEAMHSADPFQGKVTKKFPLFRLPPFQNPDKALHVIFTDGDYSKRQFYDELIVPEFLVEDLLLLEQEAEMKEEKEEDLLANFEIDLTPNEYEDFEERNWRRRRGPRKSKQGKQDEPEERKNTWVDNYKMWRQKQKLPYSKPTFKSIQDELYWTQIKLIEEIENSATLRAHVDRLYGELSEAIEEVNKLKRKKKKKSCCICM